jgi:hypothetical protein
MTHITETPFMQFWGALNAALAERGITAARYGEARDFFDSGYTCATVDRIARQWIADDDGPCPGAAWSDTSDELR